MGGRYHPYNEYKNSCIEWVGEIPSGWDTYRFKYRASIVADKAISKTNPVGLENIISWSGEFKPSDSEFQGDGVAFQPGDLLFGKLRPYLAKVYLSNTSGEAVGDFHVFRPKNIVGRYLQYLMLTKEYISVVDGSTYGAKMPRASWEFMSDMGIPCPSGNEQQTIANFLDHETAKIDTLIDKQQQLIKLLKEKRQAVISHAVTKGLNPAASMKDSGVEWFDQAPDHWKIIEFKFAAEDGRKMFTDGNWIESPYITDSGVRLLQTGNVGRGFYKEQGFRFVSEDTFKTLNCTEVKPGDVLICRLDGPVGRSCLAPNLNVKMITSVDNAILKPNGDFDSRFLVYLTNSTPWLDWIQDLCRVGGGFRLRISRTMLGDQRIPAPPVTEQAKIADTLDELSKHSLKCIQHCEESIILLQERRTALISAAVTGKIDVRNWQPAQPKIPMEASA